MPSPKDPVARARWKANMTKARMKPLKIGFNLPTEDLAYIVGVLMGDGWFRPNAVGLATIDREFSDAFTRALVRQFGRTVKHWVTPSKPMHDPRTGKMYISKRQFVVLMFSIEAKRFLETILTLDWIRGLGKTQKAAWIRGLWDSEGNIYERKHNFGWEVGLTSSDKDTVYLYCELLQEIGGIQSHIYRRTDRDSLWNVRFGCIDAVVRFYGVVQPTIRRKLERFERARMALEDRVDIYTNLLVEYDSGLSLGQLAVKYCVTSSAIRKSLIRRGGKCRSISEAMRIYNSRRRDIRQ